MLAVCAGLWALKEIGRKPFEVATGCEPNLWLLENAVLLPRPEAADVLLVVVGRNVTGRAVTAMLLKEDTPPRLLLPLALFVPKEKLPKLGRLDAGPVEKNVTDSGADVCRSSLSTKVLLTGVEAGVDWPKLPPKNWVETAGVVGVNTGRGVAPN